MRTEEIASRLATIKKSLQATDLHTLTLRVEEVEKLIEEYNSNLWTSPCICPPDEKTGETLCCNICGKPTARTSKGLPGDDVKRIANNFFQWTENLDKDDDDYVDLLYCNSRNLRLQDQINSYVASKDARIRELEDNVKYWVEAWNRLSKMFSDQNEILTTLTPPKN